MASDEDSGRIVVVAAGFALWKGGRCIAAGRWGDIRAMRARRDEGDEEAVRLVVEIKDGTMLELREAAPGFDAFLDRASVTLTGLLPFKSWHPTLMLAPASAGPTTIFERRTRY